MVVAHYRRKRANPPAYTQIKPWPRTPLNQLSVLWGTVCVLLLLIPTEREDRLTEQLLKKKKKKVIQRIRSQVKEENISHAGMQGTQLLFVWGVTFQKNRELPTQPCSVAEHPIWVRVHFWGIQQITRGFMVVPVLIFNQRRGCSARQLYTWLFSNPNACLLWSKQVSSSNP